MPDKDAKMSARLNQERPPGPPVALAAALGVWLLGSATPWAALLAGVVAAIVTLVVMRVERSQASDSEGLKALTDMISAAERRLGLAGMGDLPQRLSALLTQAAPPEAPAAPLVAIYVRDPVARAEALAAAGALGFVTRVIDAPDAASAFAPTLVVALDRDVADFAGLDAPLIALSADLADGAQAMRAGATAFVTIASGRPALIAAMARYARGREPVVGPAPAAKPEKRGAA